MSDGDGNSKLSQLKARLSELLCEKQRGRKNINELMNERGEVTDPDKYIEINGKYTTAVRRSGVILKEIIALEKEIEHEMNPVPPIAGESCADDKFVGFKERMIEFETDESMQFNCVYSFKRPKDMGAANVIPQMGYIFAWMINDVMNTYKPATGKHT